MQRFALCIALVAATLLAACSSSPVDAAGAYSISLTSRENACGFDNWTEGNTATGIPVTITQDGSDAQADVGGLAAVALDLLQGSHAFAGTVDRNDLELDNFGSRQLMRDGCPHVVNSTISATLEGDVLVGDILYTINGNGSPECAALEGCISRQEFNGTRPPQ